MSQSRPDRPRRSIAISPDAIIAGCIGLILIVCNIIRMLQVPLTCDEAPSRADLLLRYIDYVQLNKVTANIHILNSILRKASIDLFGNTPFFLRLPNLLAQILYMVYCYLLLRKLFKEGVWRIAVFLVCNLSPFLFEFWGYSRGYGLAVAFMTVSIYYLITHASGKRAIHVWIALLAAAAAVWSNFALLNYYVALCGVLLLPTLCWEHSRQFIRNVLPSLAAISAGLALLIYHPIRKLRRSGELYYGGDDNLYDDTIVSLVKENIGNPGEAAVRDASFVVACLLVLSVGYWVGVFFRVRKDVAGKWGIIFSLLVSLALLALPVQHALLGTKYLINRTALFVIILIVLAVTYTLYMLPGRIRVVGRAMLLIITATFTWNFVERTDLYKSHPWWLDNYNPDVLAFLATKHQPCAPPLKLRVSWIQMPSMDYYIYTRYPTLFEPLEYIRDAPSPADTAYDYCFLPEEDAKHLSEVYVIDTVFGHSSLYRKR